MRQRVGELMSRDGNRLRWAPDTAVVSASGDLGYALDHYWLLGEGAQERHVARRIRQKQPTASGRSWWISGREG